MSIQIIADNVKLNTKHVQFSDGGSNLKIDVPEGFKPSSYFAISVSPTTPTDNYLWEILLALDAIRTTFGNTFKVKILYLPYLPHGRADRRFEVGNSLPLEVFFNVITPYFDKIFLTDPHSDFYTKYNDVEFIVTPQEECFINTVKTVPDGCILVAPDKGALNKIYKLRDLLHVRGITSTVIEASKTRDVVTGRITSTSIPDIDLTDKTVYIVDDLLDAGGTFIPLAEKLQAANAKEINLYVTHGIFARGLNIFKNKIDKLHVHQTVGTYATATDVLNFNEGKETK